nr:ribonuclease H-like domain-containing protein [Tanacetum cinerariifolium]
LISVHKIARDIKLFIGFDDEKCYLQDLRANRTVEICNQCNGLYMFDVDNALLDVLKSTLNLDSQSVSDHLCDTCNKAKQTRELFPLSDHKSTRIGQLVHLDVWGPYKVVSIYGFRYFSTIVDDFSRAV